MPHRDLQPRQELMKQVVISNSYLSGLALFRQTPLKYATRWIGNHVVPWAARTAFVQGVHTINGVQMEIPRPPDWGGGGEFHMALGTYEKPEVDFLSARLRSGDVFVDVGAHIGYMSLQAAKAVGPTGRVIAVEPTSAALDQLRANIERNGFDWVTVYPVAIAGQDGSVEFGLNPHSPMWNRIGAKDTTHIIKVPSRSIDSIMAELGWPSIAGLKIDVEGAEAEALRGSRETLERNPGAFLLIEMEGGGRLEASLETLRFFEQGGYKFSRFNQLRAPSLVTTEAITHSLRNDYRPLFNLLVEKRR